MLARARSHVAGNLIGYLALFIALGGTSYAVATGSVDSRAIKNNSVRSKDLRNNSATGRDIRNRSLTGGDVRANSLGGAQIDEATLGEVQSAARAGDSALLGGRGPGAFARPNPAAAVDLPTGAPETTVLELAGLGKLVVESCDGTLPNTGLGFTWRNTGPVAEDVWAWFADSDDPTIAPLYGDLDPGPPPGSEFELLLNNAANNTIVSSYLVRQRGGAGEVATIQLFAKAGRTPGECTVSAQAVLSG